MPNESKDYFKDFYLEEVCVTGNLRAWYIRKGPDTRMMSTLIIETPENLCISGDYSPGLHGVVSATGYNAGWFAGEFQGTEYLCSKFMRQTFHLNDNIKDYIEYVRQEGSEGIDQGRVDEFVGRLNGLGEGDGANGLYEVIDDYFSDAGEDIGGWFYSYDKDDVTILSNIQRTFARLYHARYGKREEFDDA